MVLGLEFLAFGLLNFAQATTPACPLTALSINYPSGVVTENRVGVRFTIEGTDLHAHFDVRAADLNGKRTLGQKEYPFQFDVVEVFVSADGSQTHEPYYEFELTPFGQEFQVLVKTAKGPFIDNPGIHTRHEFKRFNGAWSADLWIPLNEIKWNKNSSSIAGNAYAILGSLKPRQHWSLTLPAQEKPNFHQPRLFAQFPLCK